MKNRFSNPNIIPTRVLMYMAWRNLTHKKLRAFLTVFGVIIGIGAIFFLLSFGIGLQRLVTSQVLGNQSVKSIDVTSSNSKIIKLDQQSFTKMQNLPHVVRAGAMYSFASSLQADGSEVDAIVYGEDDNYQQMSNLPLAAGKKLDANDRTHILMNITAYKAIGIKDAKSAIGKKVTVNIPLGDPKLKDVTATFTIGGIIDTQGGNEIYVPGSMLTDRGVSTFKQVKIEVDATENVTPMRKQIESLGFVTTSPIDTIDQINQIFAFFNIVLAGFGGIGMIVAVLGMFNTLTISLLERTKEIGLMVTLGGRNRDMRKLFIFEAMLLSFVGALFGIILAIILGQLINVAMNIFASRRGVTDHFQLFATPWWLVLGMLAFMLIVGMIVVYLPARRASRINPIDALRRE